MVNVNCTGGGGYFSDDVTATQSQVVKGHNTITHDSNDEIVEGTMEDVTSTDQCKQSAIDSQNLTLRMTNGAHRTNGATGYPEVYIPLSDLRTRIGYTDASKVLKGTTIAGLAGSMVNNGPWNGTLGLSNDNNGSVTIPAGYHNGLGKITRAYSTYGPSSAFTPGVSDVTIPTKGKFLTADIYCKAEGNLLAQNIVNGVSIFGMTGTMMKYTSGSDSTIFNNGTWSNQMRYGMTGIIWHTSGPSVSDGSYSKDTSSYLDSSTSGNGYHVSGFAQYSAGTTLDCTTKWGSYQASDEGTDEYGFGVVYLRANQTFNPTLYSGIQIVRDFYGSGSTTMGQTMYVYLYDTSGNLIANGSNTQYAEKAYSSWKKENLSYTFSFPTTVYSYSQLRLVIKFRNTQTGATNYTSAIKSMTLIKR